MYEEVLARAPVSEEVTALSFADWFFRTRRVVTFLNPVNYEMLRRSFGDISGIDHVFFDGIFAARWIGKLSGNAYKRLSFDFTSVAPPFFEYCSKHGKKLYIVGAKDTELSAFVSLLEASYKKLQIVGRQHGYINIDQITELSKNIEQAGSDVVLCGMGCPKQEQFSVELSKLLPNVSFITCGGFIHQTQNKLQYYPSWVDKTNLRSVYRFYKEPHTRKRLKFYPKFVWATLKKF